MQGQIPGITQLVSFADSANLDSFSRLRISQPSLVFDAQLTYDLAPLIYEQVTSGGGTVTHSSTNRCAVMTFSSVTGSAYMQSYEHFRYQAGRSQLIFITFNMNGGVANCIKFAGYSDGSNGIEFRMDGTTPKMVRLSDTSAGDLEVTQSNWNIDKLNGTGKSGITLDTSKTQILVIDIQALYVGRVRVGFDIGGNIIYVHEFLHANLIADPYIQTANLPIRVGMTSSSNVTTTMNFICSSVLSEGGDVEAGGYSFSCEGTVTAGSGTRTHLLSLRPKTTFNSITNRSKFILESVDVAVTGNFPVLWELCIGQAISGTTTFNDVNTSYSAYEFNTLGTISGSPTLVVNAGYTTSSASTKLSTSFKTNNKYPITLNAAGAVRSLGTLSLIVTGIGGASACRAFFNFKEIR